MREDDYCDPYTGKEVLKGMVFVIVYDPTVSACSIHECHGYETENFSKVENDRLSQVALICQI